VLRKENLLWNHLLQESIIQATGLAPMTFPIARLTGMTGQPHHRPHPLRKEKPLESAEYEKELF
jgi:hypothetical protein